MLLRGTAIVISLVAWLSISNHCALGALQRSQSTSVHAKCHGNSSPASKPSGNSEETPCCKVLRATIASPAHAPAYDFSVFVLQPSVVDLPLLSDQFQPSHPLEFDTGPPFSRSFAESVLQRSILAHAPPALI